ncbi:MAG: hypothetical protein JXM71_07615 [Spirochaetales bacterium]|nr:hypothetical protein [Spirochaetales bacterium]
MFDKLHKLLEKKELAPDKRDVELEKNDFLAIMIALSMYVFPVLLGVFLLFALVAWVLF